METLLQDTEIHKRIPETFKMLQKKNCNKFG